MVEKNGKWPANARVDVDYSKGKPKIKFTYPKNGDSAKKQAERQNNFGPHTFIIIILIYTLFWILPSINIGDQEYPGECRIDFDRHYLNISLYAELDGVKTNINEYKRWIEGANIFYKKNNFERERGFRMEMQRSPLLIIGLVFSFLWILGLIGFLSIKYSTRYLVKQKWYQKWLPKHQAEGFFGNRGKKYIKFKPEDVENNMVEIPCFKNVELDYKTEGDFSDKLERIRIREHQHYKYKKGKVGKKKIDVYKWYARFYFKDKPKDGYLEVIFQ